MFGLRGFFFVLALACLIPASRAAFVVDSGKAGCVVVVPRDASPGELYAAKELRDHINQMTGVDLKQLSERDYRAAAGPCISIGRTKLSKKFVTDKQMQAFGEDGYRVFANNDNLFIVGGRRHGSMYAVYEYLESLGVRWWAPDYTVIPKLSQVAMPEKPFCHKPQFFYRDQFWNNGTTVEWRARMRINGSNGIAHSSKGRYESIPEEMGGSTLPFYGCHSYMYLIPPEKYLASHPKWYAYRPDGTRSSLEMCLTNPELREFVVQQVLADLRSKQGKIDHYWVSQNDGVGPGCQCEKCTAERMAHGGKDMWSANTISFTNYVAGKVKQEFPKVLIKTLAYSYTQVPPENIKVADNVLVEICGNFSAGGDDPQAKCVRTWSKLAKNISVYTYGGAANGYFWPFPNVWEDGMQYIWARCAGVGAYYVQGSAVGKGSAMVDLKGYLSARMAWDPSRDVWKEINDFCDGFYGPGGPYVAEYLNNHLKYINMGCGWGHPDFWREWVTKDKIVYCDGLFQKALAAVKDNPVYLNHVRRAYLEVLWGSIMIDLKPGSDLMDKEFKLVSGADVNAVRQRAKLFGEIMRENGYDQWSEYKVFEPAKYPH